MQGATVLENALRRDRAIVLVGLALVAALAWAYLVYLAWGVQQPVGMSMSQVRLWNPIDFGINFIMWAVMMTAMMLPSAAPLIMLVIGTYRRRGERARLLTLAFGSGYLIAWTAFSAAAALLQFALHRAALLSPSMAATSALAGGAIFVAAGVYQWLPVKAACLMHCRSPLAFLGSHWRQGAGGALAMGLHHGLFCIGCCWTLMLLLFAAGVMNLFWVGVIAAFVLVEKIARGGARIGRIAGVLLAAWGLWIMAGTYIGRHLR